MVAFVSLSPAPAMTRHLAARLLLPLVLAAAPALAQDVVTLHSVTIDGSNNVTVVYSKNFATCAHLRFSNAACTQLGALTHVQNIFCTQGVNVTVTRPLSAFVAGFGPNIPVFMVHGNNSNVRSACVTVGCEGSYGTGCAGASGAPTLAANNACPLAGSTVILGVGNGPATSVAFLGLGLTTANTPVLGCNLLIGTILVSAVLPLDAAGAGNFSLQLPPGTGGIAFTGQSFVLDPSGPQGFTATNGLLVRVQ